MLSRNKEVHTSSNPHMYTHILKKASSSCYKRRQEVFNTGIIYSFTDRFAGGWSASHYPPPRRSGLISPRPASAILWLDRSIGRKASEQAIYIYRRLFERASEMGSAVLFYCICIAVVVALSSSMVAVGAAAPGEPPKFISGTYCSAHRGKFNPFCLSWLNCAVVRTCTSLSLSFFSERPWVLR